MFKCKILIEDFVIRKKNIHINIMVTFPPEDFKNKCWDHDLNQFTPLLNVCKHFMLQMQP